MFMISIFRPLFKRKKIRVVDAGFLARGKLKCEIRQSCKKIGVRIKS